MNVMETNLKGVFDIEPQVFGDSRGWFMETWSKIKLEGAGLNFDFVQDNQSYSAQKGTLRGLHYQLNPMSQAKIVRCTRGTIMDVAVDVRKNSPQFSKWTSVILSGENKKQILVPRGFAHGFLTLSDDVEIQYKADNYYAPHFEGNIRWDDPQIKIDWPFEPTILADKDKNAPTLAERVEHNELNFMFDEAIRIQDIPKLL